jgi:hypothetical protein
VDHAERLTFESMAPPGDGYLRGNIAVMGSVAPLPSIESIISAFSTVLVKEWRIVG